MKRLLRIVALTLAVAVICLSFTGCEALDRAREEHGIWDNNKTEIDLNGTRYIEIPFCLYLDPVYWGSSYISVTDSDVPVLLKSFYGENFYISDDRIFICDGHFAFSDTYYCHSDYYEDAIRQIDEGVKIDKYRYRYSYYDKKINDIVYLFYELTKEQKEAIDKVSMESEPIKSSDFTFYDYDHYVEIEGCSNDMIFRDHTFNIYVIGQDYYVEKYSVYSPLFYRVPDDMKPIFEEIMKMYVEYKHSWKDYYAYN